MLKRNILLLTVLIITLSIGNLTALTQKSFAANITPSTKTYTVKPEDLILDAIEYKNDSKLKETITLSISAYDAKSEKSITDKPFITIKQAKYTISPNSKLSIDYIATIPKETPAGTYFNVIYIQKLETTKTSDNVAIIPTIGVLFTFHVEESNTSLNKLFFEKSDIKLIVKQKGLPYFLETEFEYTYKNNSNFIFKPEGEIRILDANDQQLQNRYEINSEKKSIYPGESFTQSFSANIWNDYKSIFETKSIVSKTYSDIDGSSVLNKVTLSIINQVGVIAIVIGILIITLLYLLISTIVKAFKVKKVKAL